MQVNHSWRHWLTRPVLYLRITLIENALEPELSEPLIKVRGCTDLK